MASAGIWSENSIFVTLFWHLKTLNIYELSGRKLEIWNVIYFSIKKRTCLLRFVSMSSAGVQTQDNQFVTYIYLSWNFADFAISIVFFFILEFYLWEIKIFFVYLNKKQEKSSICKFIKLLDFEFINHLYSLCEIFKL